MQTIQTITEIATNGIIQNPQLAIMLAQTIYSQLTAEKLNPLIDEINGNDKYIDRTRYNRLCNLRKNVCVALGQAVTIPQEWVLNNDDCPQHVLTDIKASEYLTSMKTTLQEINSPQTSSVIAILSRIESVFEVIQLRKIENKSIISMKEKWKFFRKDGVEAMFFMDLATWACTKLAHYNLNEQATVNTLQIWINYCSEVKSSVLFCRFSDEISKYKDPRENLEHIIKGLQYIQKNIIKRIKAESFNDKLMKLNQLFNTLSKDTFNFLYLLLDDVNRSSLVVSELVAHANNTIQHTADPNVKRLLNTSLGNLLIKTLDKAGIYHDDFSINKKIDVTAVESYLSEYVVTNPKEKYIKNSGLWSFAQIPQYKIAIGLPIAYANPGIIYFEFKQPSLHYTVLSPNGSTCKGIIDHDELQELDLNLTTDLRKEQLKSMIEHNLSKILETKEISKHTYSYQSNIISYFNKIILIHRKLLMVINSITAILASAEVNTTYGKSWVYGEDTDHAIIDQLSYTLQESSATLLDQINDFWLHFHTNHYKKYLRHQDDTFLSNYRMTECDKTVSSLNNTNGKIVSVINDIKSARQDPENNPRVFKDCIVTLKKILAESTLVINRISTSNRKQEFPDTDIIVENISMPLIQEIPNNIISSEPAASTESSELIDTPNAVNNIAVNIYNDHIITSSINIKPGSMDLFEDIVNALQATDTSFIDCISKPEIFHTKLQEDLYKDFLILNIRTMKIKPILAIFVWISPSLMPHLTLLYAQINKVMHLLYHEETLKSYANSLSLEESHLIDILLYNHITTAFEKHKFYKYALNWDTKPLTITIQDDQSYLVTYDPFKSSEAKTIEAYSIESHILRNQIVTLENSCSQLTEQIASKDLIIQENQLAIVEQQTQLEEKDRQIIEREVELSDTKVELGDTQVELSETHVTLSATQIALDENRIALFQAQKIIQLLSQQLEKSILDFNKQFADQNEDSTPIKDTASIPESNPIIVSNIEIQEQIPKETTQITLKAASMHKETSLLSKTLGIFSHKSSKEPQQSSLFTKRA